MGSELNARGSWVSQVDAARLLLPSEGGVISEPGSLSRFCHTSRSSPNTFLFQNPQWVPRGALAASSRVESLSRGLEMERERGSRSDSTHFLLCLLLFQDVEGGVGLTPGLIPFFPGQLLECFAASVRELPLWHGAQGFGNTHTPPSSCWGCACSVIPPL